MPESLWTSTLVLILTAATAVALARVLRLPPSVAFLAAGIVIGPHGLGGVAPSEGTTFFSELGVVLLMFLTGLEFSLAEMTTSRVSIVAAGGLQVALVTSVTALVAVFFGLNRVAAVIVGGVAALSSTAVALKQLSEQGELGTAHGRLAAGMLVVQDFVALPFLLLAGTAQTSRVALALGRQLVIAGIGLVAIVLVGRRVFGAALAWIARARSEELFLLSSLALALGAAYVAQVAGLPVSIGAFLAGMVLAETDFRHQIEENIRPFRDVSMGLFFMSIGMQIDPAVISSAPYAVLGWTLVFTVGKGVLTGVVARMLGWPSHVAARTGVVLAQGGEFGFLLLTQAMNNAVLTSSQTQPMLVALLLTMALAPVLIQRSGGIAKVITGAETRPDVSDHGEAAVENRSSELTEHVILCGCGRVGRPVAVVLDVAGVPYIAIESDVDRFRRAKSAGHNVVFADASHSRILDRSGIERAGAVVITFSDRQSVQRVLHHAQYRNARAALIVSAADDADLPALVEAGATVVFPEHLAAGLALAGQVLRLSGRSEEQTARLLTQARAVISPALGGRVGI